MPVKTTVPAKIAKDKQTKFINILKTDHKFDLVKKIVDHISMIERAKKIKPIEKHRMLQTYYIALLSYALPKMKVTEDNSDKNSSPMNFQINIGSPAPAASGNPNTPKKSGKKKSNNVSITIPTKKNPDGSYSVSS